MDTTSKERPIIFSAEMVQGILEGRKTQTRRVVKPQPTELKRHHILGGKGSYSPRIFSWDNRVAAIRAHRAAGGRTPNDLIAGISGTTLVDYCPYGQPGDRLYVKETFARIGFTNNPEYGLECDGSIGLHDSCYHSEIVYAADGRYEMDLGERWIPSIHMPRWASRITLEIVNVRVERLQDISDWDCVAEGMDPGGSPPPWNESMARFRYRQLWGKLNAKRGYGWDVNPWVWVLQFKRVQP